jgi:hypothetical protein
MLPRSKVNYTVKDVVVLAPYLMIWCKPLKHPPWCPLYIGTTWFIIFTSLFMNLVSMLSVNRMFLYTISQLLHTHLLQVLNCREQMFFMQKKCVLYHQIIGMLSNCPYSVTIKNYHTQLRLRQSAMDRKQVKKKHIKK